MYIAIIGLVLFVTWFLGMVPARRALLRTTLDYNMVEKREGHGSGTYALMAHEPDPRRQFRDSQEIQRFIDGAVESVDSLAVIAWPFTFPALRRRINRSQLASSEKGKRERVLLEEKRNRMFELAIGDDDFKAMDRIASCSTLEELESQEKEGNRELENEMEKARKFDSMDKRIRDMEMTQRSLLSTFRSIRDELTNYSKPASTEKLLAMVKRGMDEIASDLNPMPFTSEGRIRDILRNDIHRESPTRFHLNEGSVHIWDQRHRKWAQASRNDWDRILDELQVLSYVAFLDEAKSPLEDDTLTWWQRID